MPYVEKHDRAKLEAYIKDLSEDLARRFQKNGTEAELGVLYKNALVEVCDAIISKESGKDQIPRTPAQRMGHNLWDVAKRKGGSIRVDWLGNLNYCVTRLIQQTPRIVMANNGWKFEFDHKLYIATSGALQQTALEIRTRYVPPNIEWVLDGLVGVLFDIQDEYKRRVHIAHEATRIRETGDIYDAPFRTEIVIVKDNEGKEGYREIMLDFSDKKKVA